MNFKLKKTTLISTVILLGGLCAAQTKDAKQIVGAENYNKLLKEQQIISFQDSGSNELKLLPQSVYAFNIKNSISTKQKGKFPFTYEAVYLISKEDLLKSNKSRKKDITIDDVSVACRSISKLEGITYYSTTRKKETVLYKKAFTISSPTSSTAIADNIKGNANKQVSYCLMEDKSFGDIKYKVSYFQSENEILAQFENVNELGLGIIKAIEPEKLKISMLVEDCGSDLVIYLCADLESKDVPGLKGKISDSIISRVDAIKKWFLMQF